MDSPPARLISDNDKYSEMSVDSDNKSIEGVCQVFMTELNLDPA
jgi:hypothetical protein